MLELIARLLVALSVALGAHGVTSAGGHASPDGNAHAVAAIEAAIARLADLAAGAREAAAAAPELTGLDRALEVADEHAADGLAKAAAAKAAGQAKAAAARGAHQPAAGGAGQAPADKPAAGGPPFEVPPVDGPPATHPPVPAPPVDAPGQGNRP
jgi:hypothetical protein